MAIAGAFFGVLFAIGTIARGDVAPGIVGGALGGILVYLVLQRAQEHHRRRASEDDVRKHAKSRHVD
jgi:hypothetical protein